MLLVLDANVLVEGLCNPLSSSGRLLDAVLREQVTLAWTEAVIDDYATLLGHESFQIDFTRADKLLTFLQENGKQVEASGKFNLSLPVAGDTRYYCCAVDADCPLVTNNVNHYPNNGPVEIMDPARVLFRG